jgi:hypothetical protein
VPVDASRVCRYVDIHTSITVVDVKYEILLCFITTIFAAAAAAAAAATAHQDNEDDLQSMAPSIASSILTADTCLPQFASKKKPRHVFGGYYFWIFWDIWEYLGIIWNILEYFGIFLMYFGIFSCENTR